MRTPRRRPDARRGLARWLVGGAVVAALVLGVAGPAGATDYHEFDSRITVEPDGTFTVVELVTVEFPHGRHGIFRDLPVKHEVEPGSETLRAIRVDLVSVQRRPVVEGVDGVSVADFPFVAEPVSVESLGPDGEVKRFRIGDPDRLIDGPHQYRIVYSVEGAFNSFPEHEELYWNVLGGEWEGPFARVTATVEGPPIVRSTCSKGPLGSTDPCAEASEVAGGVSYADGDLGAGGHDMSVVVAFAPGDVVPGPPIFEERWRTWKVVAATPLNAGLGVAALAAVGVPIGLRLRRGRDPHAGPGLHAPAGTAVPVGADPDDAPVRFRPPEGLKPAHLGLLDDEAVDPVDVGATIIDLAVRGYLVVDDRRDTGSSKPEWVVRLQPSGPPGDQLEPFEARLLDGLRSHAEDGEVDLASVKGEFHSDYRAVTEFLYDDALERGWFSRRPDRVRTAFFLIGMLLLGVGIGLTVVAGAARLELGWPGVAVALGGLVTMVFSKRFPAKTPAGTRALIETRGFKKFIETAEKPEMNYAADRGEFLRYLPHAVAFGAVDSWTRAARGLDVAAATTGWYVGHHLYSWNHFGQEFSSFAGDVGTSLRTTPASSGSSGFSGGGGGSGGGFGGGGGGSW